NALQPAGIPLDGVPLAAPEPVQTTDPAAGASAPSNPVAWVTPAQATDPATSNLPSVGRLKPAARPVEPPSGGHGIQAKSARTPDDLHLSHAFQSAGNQADGVPVAARGSVQTTDPAAGAPVPSNPVAWVTSANHAPAIKTTGWRVPDDVPARAVVADRYAALPTPPRPEQTTGAGAVPVAPDGLSGTNRPLVQATRPMAEDVAMPRPGPAQPGVATPVLATAQPPAGAEPARATEPVIPRQDDAGVFARQAEMPELVEGRVSKAYLRGQAADAPVPESDVTARTRVAAEFRASGDRGPERDGRHHESARPPVMSASFIEHQAGGGGLGHVFSVRTPESPAGETGPVRQEPTSGGQPLDQAIVKSLKVQWNQGVGEARLRLQPEFLGDLSVSLRVIGASVTAVLSSDSPAVREWVQAHQADLRRALEEAGLTLDNLVVDGDGHPQDQREQTAQGGHRRPARQKPEAGRFEALL
ncbi:MAG: flagellar hook-length control protein FliK, partial [Vicinamibacterales bacterium]|nr:flagellar hook-length control protein FliK [Vicinamibacterales bacterium]